MSDKGPADARAGAGVRPATAGDRPFILGLAGRLATVAGTPLRDPAAVLDFQRRAVEAALDEPLPGSATLVAEAAGGGRLGFVHLEPASDFFTGEAYGYVSLVAVAEASEGRGAARALLGAAERWALGRGYRWLGLNVFAANGRARALYGRLGYEEETLKLVKPLRP